ncbi:TPA: hypoxanthine phosphoribosyltransferase [bacterium]|nr:hypoxanthine phosphoribosyltransferase [bacterium]
MKVFIPRNDIKRKVKELAEKISSEYENGLVVIGVLKGAFVFMADFVRQLTCPVYIDFIKVSSYKGKETTGEINLELSCSIDLKGKDVLVVEDIVDTGITLSFIKEFLAEKDPKSLKVCCFLDKPERRKVDFIPDYVGFTIPNRFVVGYGLDCSEEYRSLPYIATLD